MLFSASPLSWGVPVGNLSGTRMFRTSRSVRGVLDARRRMRGVLSVVLVLPVRVVCGVLAVLHCVREGRGV